MNIKEKEKKKRFIIPNLVCAVSEFASLFTRSLFPTQTRIFTALYWGEGEGEGGQQ